jgi:hypothetical protein
MQLCSSICLCTLLEELVFLDSGDFHLSLLDKTEWDQCTIVRVIPQGINVCGIDGVRIPRLLARSSQHAFLMRRTGWTLPAKAFAVSEHQHAGFAY